MNLALNIIKRHEGFRAKPYRDAVGKLTIGYGHNLDDLPLTPDQAAYLLVTDLERLWNRVKYAKPFVARLDSVRQAALQDMVYNLGVRGLLGFRRMWQAIEDGDWERTAVEALDSRWAMQVGQRAKEDAEMLRTGEWP